MKAITNVLMASIAVYGVSISGASARSHYGARYYYAPEDEIYFGAPPPPPVGFVFMRHSPRCEYPHGWSSVDFGRSLNGIPRGGHELLATGCGAYEPLAD